MIGYKQIYTKIRLNHTHNNSICAIKKKKKKLNVQILISCHNLETILANKQKKINSTWTK